MRGTLLGTDFIYNKDGELVPTEINTAIRPDIRINTDLKGTNFISDLDDYFSHQRFNTFLQENSITKVIVIENGGGGYGMLLKAFCEYYNYEFEQVLVGANAINVPEIADDVATLVIRIAYDSYSIVDDLYCRDMYEFHNLIKYEDFAIPTKFADHLGLDAITQFKDYVDNSVPNYVVKARVPGYIPTDYPKLYRLDTVDELNSLKNSLTENEFLSEYFWNASKLINNRTNFIRSVDLIWGEELEVLPLFSYKAINSVAVNNEKLVYDAEIDSNKKLDNLYASKYYPSWFSKTGLSYHFDATDSILLKDGLLKLAKDLDSSDVITGIHFNTDLSDFKSQPETVLNSFVTGDAILGGVTPNKYAGIFVNIKVTHSEYGDFEWFDGVESPYLIKLNSTNEVKYSYEGCGDLNAGDEIYIYNSEANSIIPFLVTDVTYQIYDIPTFLLSLGNYENSETKYSEFLIQITNDNYTEETSKLFLIQHNTCNSTNCVFGGPIAQCTVKSGCTTCGKNSLGCIDCGGATVTTCSGQ